MKLLFLTSSLGGGGAETQMAYLSEGLVAAGHEVHIAFVSSTRDDEEGYSGSRLHSLSCRSNYDPRILFALMRLVRREKPDIIQSWSVQMTVIGGILALWFRKTWIYREANSSLLPLRKTVRPLIRFMARYADTIVANSKAGDRYWGGVHPSVPREVILNGFPIKRIDRIGTEEAGTVDTPATDRLVVFVGRLSEQKNPVVFMKAFLHITMKHSVGLVVCGTGRLEGEMRALSQAAGLEDRVAFAGHVKHETVWSLMKKSDLLVLPSLYEGLPNVAVEAALCRCPLILSDIPEHHDIFTAEAAFFSGVQNENELVDTIEYALSNKAVADEKAAHARVEAEEFSLECMVSRYISLYERL